MQTQKADNSTLLGFSLCACKIALQKQLQLRRASFSASFFLSSLAKLALTLRLSFLLFSFAFRSLLRRVILAMSANAALAERNCNVLRCLLAHKKRTHSNAMRAQTPTGAFTKARNARKLLASNCQARRALSALAWQAATDLRSSNKCFLLVLFLLCFFSRLFLSALLFDLLCFVSRLADLSKASQSSKHRAQGKKSKKKQLTNEASKELLRNSNESQKRKERKTRSTKTASLKFCFVSFVFAIQVLKVESLQKSGDKTAQNFATQKLTAKN